jgi:hypothetical protein
MMFDRSSRLGVGSGFEKLEDIVFAQERANRLGRLCALLETTHDRFGVEANFVGAGVVEAEFFEGATIASRGALSRYDPVAGFTFFTEALQSEFDHRLLGDSFGVEAKNFLPN